MLISILVVRIYLFIVLSLFGNVIGEKGARVCVYLGVKMNIVLGMILFYEGVVREVCVEVSMLRLISSDVWCSELCIETDIVVSVMVCLVVVISSIVKMYSIEYLDGDKSVVRYLSYLELFVISMIVLLSSNNLIVFFIGWELVGLVSYLLVSYWSTNIENVKSGVQAIGVNRLGDVCVMVGVIFLMLICGGSEISLIKSVILEVDNELKRMISIFLLVGVCSKSGQFGMHIWLANAMAAPTPVSALLHAATMVTVGVYLLIRLNSLFVVVEELMIMIGSITVIMMGIMGVISKDVKRIIAYSTGSQLGYMVLCCGMGVYGLSLFHLICHGFFKALLFLSVGVVIHGIGDEQDVRKMGGLGVLEKISYLGAMVGTMSLMGAPYTTGYVSKDMIIEVSLGRESNFYVLVGAISSMLGVLLTSIYSVRGVMMVYCSKVSLGRRRLERRMLVGSKMRISIIVLSVLSVVGGKLLQELIVTIESRMVLGDKIIYLESELMTKELKGIICLLVIIGVSLWRVESKVRVLKVVYGVISKRLMVDKVVNEVIVGNILGIVCRSVMFYVEKGVMELLVSRGVLSVLGVIGGELRRVRRGRVYDLIMICVVVLILCFIVVFV